jgi:ADP-ribose diphosphatase
MSVLSKKIVYTSKYFQVNQIEIERDGKTFVKDIIEENPIAVVIPYTQDGDIYLLLEYRDALGKVNLGIIGGKITPGEDSLTGAKKELLQEAGLKAKIWKHAADWETSPVMQKKMSVFFATELEKGEQKLDYDEKIEVVKVSLIEALEKIDNGDIPVAIDVATILLFDKMRREGKL